MVVIRPGRTWDDAALLAGVIAEEDGQPLGVALYEIVDGECEVVVLASVVENRGSGTACLDAVAAIARAEGCGRLFLFTTNDNIRALRLYQRRGWDMVALHRNAMDEVRMAKPDEPLIGDNDIPLRHMIELELLL